MGLRVVRASRPDLLVDALAARLAVPVADPLVTHLVGVPTRALGDWARGEVARLTGVVAGVEFVRPALFLRALLGEDPEPDDPWRAERLAWWVLAALERHDRAAPPGAPWTERPERLWVVARHLAERFERYGVQRPGMLVAWAAGRDVDGDDADAAPLPGHLAWQASLWREVRAAIGTPAPAERLAAAAAAPAVDGPPLTVFGPWTLGAPGVDLVARLAAHRDVAVLASGPVPGSHPLLARWGRTATEAAALVDRLVTAVRGADVTVLEPPRPEAADQLARLRDALARPAPAEPATSPVLGPDPEHRAGDGSVRVHGCHGLTRQLEVLRDALTHELGRDPELLPRDVLVVCADPAAVAPLVGPVLGAEVAGRALPVALDDRSAAGPPPVFAAADRVLALASARLDRDEVDAVLALPPVRAALGLEDDDLRLLSSSVDRLAVRWGVDGAHRTRWGYPAERDEDTWRPALDRLVAGVLFHPEPGRVVAAPRGPLAPADHLADPDLAAVGRIRAALGALLRVADLGGSRRPAGAWAAELETVVAALLVPMDRRTAALRDLRQQARQVAAAGWGLAADAEAAGAADVPLDVRELRAALADRLTDVAPEPPGPDRIRVAGLSALRGVPARVVALVGLDEAALRAPAADRDDVLALRPRPGEAHPEEAVRAALLDAVLAADRLVVTFDGQHVVTGERAALATAVEELCDALPEPAGADAADVAVPLVTRHPRHLADPRNLGVDVPAVGPRVAAPGAPAWTHQPIALATSERLRRLGPRVLGAAGRWRVEEADGWRLRVPDGAAPAWDGPDGLPLDVARVDRTLRGPAAAFLRARLGVSVPGEPEAPPRHLELWADGLTEAALGRDLLEVVRAGGDPAVWRRDRPARGGVPPGRIGRALLEAVVAEVDAVDAAAGRPRGAPEVRTAVAEVEVGGAGRRVLAHSGGAAGGDGAEALDVGFVRDHPRELVAPWLRLLVAAAAAGDGHGAAAAGHAAVLHVRRGERGEGPVVRRLRIAGADPAARAATARATLAELLRLELVLRTRPAPVFGRATWAMAEGWSPSDLKGELERDVEHPATRLVVGDVDLLDLGRQLPGPVEAELPAPPSGPDDPAHRWAAALLALRTASLVVEGAP